MQVHGSPARSRQQPGAGRVGSHGAGRPVPRVEAHGATTKGRPALTEQDVGCTPVNRCWPWLLLPCSPAACPARHASGGPGEHPDRPRPAYEPVLPEQEAHRDDRRHPGGKIDCCSFYAQWHVSVILDLALLSQSCLNLVSIRVGQSRPAPWQALALVAAKDLTPGGQDTAWYSAAFLGMSVVKVFRLLEPQASPSCMG